ncbi:MAG: hypothetical protein WA364_24025 [Candidatus Nitrosopolaris sp.]
MNKVGVVMAATLGRRSASHDTAGICSNVEWICSPPLYFDELVQVMMIGGE